MDKKLLTEAYKVMKTIRRFEETVSALYAENLIRGSIHLSIGHEAVSAGVGLALRNEDKIVGTYRGHGHAIAKKIPVKYLMAEMLGKETGISRGRGGSMHFADVSRGVLPTNAIVGAGIPHAVGAAFTAKYLKQDWIGVAFFGDGATNQGAFHEALNLASMYKLPVLLVCENNLYSQFTPIKYSSPVKDLVERAEAYKIPSYIVDGYSVEKVHEATTRSIEHIRSGKGPVFLEMKTYRLVGHMYGDPDVYRDKEEVAAWTAKDPVKVVAEDLSNQGVNVEEVDDLVEKEIEEAVIFAKESPLPDPEQLYDGVYFTE